MNIDEMQAGREMDCQIALRAMGWTEAGWDCDMHEYNGVPGNGANGVLYIVPNYSTEISAAWQVIEKMPMPLELAKSYEKVYESGPIGWQVCWCPNEMNQCEGCNDDCRCTSGNDVWAETAPLAICKAALKTLEVNA